jgi:hypothetical protein
LILHLADPIECIPQHEAEDYIIHLLAETAAAEGIVDMLLGQMDQVPAANRKQA